MVLCWSLYLSKYLLYRMFEHTAEFTLGGLAACGACFFSNPLEVVKTRMQLQGELQVRGSYRIHYRNVFHAFFTIARVDGLLALQKGLVPGLYYQFVMNGLRLGTYQTLQNIGLTKDTDGRLSVGRCVIAGGFSGCVGAFVASPMYLIKTHIQAQATQAIAVGHQHSHHGFHRAFIKIYQEFGIPGLWRGVTGAIPRVMIGSSAQLSSFSKTRDLLRESQLFNPDSLLLTFSASMCSSVVVSIVMTPLDVVSTRLYNQGTTTAGKGVLYSGFIDCIIKVFRKEGLWGFYKGLGAVYFRLGPHTVLNLVFWQHLRIAFGI